MELIFTEFNFEDIIICRMFKNSTNPTKFFKKLGVGFSSFSKNFVGLFFRLTKLVFRALPKH